METIRLGNILQIKHGYAFKGEYFTDEDTGKLVLTPGNFSLKGGFQQTKKFTNEDGFPDEFILKPGDLIVTMTDLSKEIDTIGYSALVPNDGKQYLHNQRIGLVTIIDPRFDKGFIYWLMRSKHYQRSIANTSNGATVHHTSPARIYNYQFAKIDLHVQRRIASILSAYDNLIENNTRRIRLLEQMAENIYKEWFIRFPGHENAEFENGLPKGWQTIKLSEYADIVMGQSPDSQYYNESKIGLPFHQGVGSYGYFYLNDDVYSSQGKKIAEPNSIIFSVRAPVGRINLTLHRIIIGRGVCSINAKDGTNAFLLWLLKDKFSKEDTIGNGAIFASVTKDELSKQKILIPDNELLLKFNRIADHLEKQIRLLTSQNHLLTRQRDLLLPRLMSGKLEVH